MSEPVSILDEAKALVYGDRNVSYGHPAIDFARTAKMVSPIFGIEVTPEQVAMFMICVKLSRLVNSHSRDTVIDIAGYADCLQRTVEYNTDTAKGGDDANVSRGGSDERSVHQ